MGQKVSKKSPQSMDELRRDVNFTQEEIQAWYGEYQDSLATNKTELTETEFKKVYNSLFIGDASTFAEHIFRTFDTDNSGTVNFKEFLVGLCVSGRDCSTDAKLKWAFQMYDINGDGFICPDEMRTIIEAIFKMTQALLPDGMESAKKMSDSFFARFDVNGDKKISYEEFREGAQKDPTIIHMLECDPDPTE